MGNRLIESDNTLVHAIKDVSAGLRSHRIVRHLISTKYEENNITKADYVTSS